MSTATNKADAFAALEHINAGDWDDWLPLFRGAALRRATIYNHKRQPDRTELADHQLWVWMTGPGRPHWVIVGTGALLP